MKNDDYKKYLKSYFETNFLEYSEAQELAQKIRTDEEIVVIELGGGIGNYSVPVIHALTRQMQGKSINWVTIDKNRYLFNFTQHLLNKVFEQGKIFWEKDEILKEIESWSPTNKVEKQITKNGLTIRYITENLERIAPGDIIGKIEACHKNDSYNLLLYIPYILYRLNFWPQLLDYFLSSCKKDQIRLVMGLAAGDWLLHDKRFAFFTEENRESQFKFWKTFWDTLLKDYPSFTRDIEATSFHTVIEYIRDKGWEVREVKRVTVENKVNLEKDVIGEWVKEGYFSIWEKVKQATRMEKEEFDNRVDTALSECFREYNNGNKLNCRFQNYLFLFNLEKKMRSMSPRSCLPHILFPKLHFQLKDVNQIEECLTYYGKLLVKHKALPEEFSMATLVAYLASEASWYKKPLHLLNPQKLINSKDKIPQEILQAALGVHSYIESRPQLRAFSFTEFFFRDIIEKINSPFFLEIKNSENGPNEIILEQDEKSLMRYFDCFKLKATIEKNNTLKSIFGDITFSENEIDSDKLLQESGIIPLEKLQEKYTEKANPIIKALNGISSQKIELKNVTLLIRKELEEQKDHLSMAIQHISATHYAFDLIYAIPVELVYEGTYKGSLILWAFFQNKENNLNEDNIEKFLLEVTKPALYKIATHIAIVDFSTQWRKHALRSAITAIMARNMSHNIGSHVLNYLSNPEELGSLWII